MTKLRTIFTIVLAKAITFLLKIITRSGATALPGLITQKLHPSILQHFAKQIPHIIVITGTNGKTTTQTLLREILQKSGYTVLSNKSGSNLKRGLISEFIKTANISGKIQVDYAILEIEEATMPKVIQDLQPEQIIVTNIYRDQLDAYGEIDRTQSFITTAINMVPTATVILNGDDPRVVEISEDIKNQVMFYGVEQEAIKDFKYEGLQKNMLKHITRADKIKIKQDLSTSFRYSMTEYELQTPGVFHIYNALAAIISAKFFRIKDNLIKAALAETKPAFGRGEVINKDGIDYHVLLVKNPAGLILSLNLLKKLDSPNVAFLLNDNIADGRDVSWIWDSELEILNEIKPKFIACSGTRSYDMLLRVKYALGGLDTSKTKASVYENESALHQDLLQKEIKQIYVLPTYTAMLSLRKFLTGKALNE